MENKNKTEKEKIDENFGKAHFKKRGYNPTLIKRYGWSIT